MTPTKAVTAQLRKAELRLKRRHGVRVNMDKIAADRSHVLCTTWRSGLAVLQRRMDEHEIVDLVHDALRPLHTIGLRPLVGVVQKRTLAEVPEILMADPFHLLAALRRAEESGNGPAGISLEEAERRSAVLSTRRVLK